MRNEQWASEKAAARAMRWVIVAGLAIGGAAHAADPKMEKADVKSDSTTPTAVAKPDKNALKASMTGVQAAIAALQKEVAAHQKDPKIALRDKCNYFIENPSKDVLAETVMSALSSTINPDAPSDSYIKWQLMSGTPAKYDETLGRLAAAAYLKAAKPLNRPGLSQQDKRQLDPLIASVHNTDESLVATKKLADLIDPWEERNKPVLAYRDELYTRIPALMAESLVARFDDVTQRIEAGYAGEVPMKAITDDITKWTDNSPTPAQLYVMIERVKNVIRMEGGAAAKTVNNTPNSPGGGMRGRYNNQQYNNNNGGGMNAGFPPKYYDHVEFDSKYNKWKWADANGRNVRAEVMTDLLAALEDAAKTAQKEMATKK